MSDNPADYPAYWDRRARESLSEVAQDYLMGATTGNTSTHYHALSVAPVWKFHYTVDGIVGDHIFYTCSSSLRNC